MAEQTVPNSPHISWSDSFSQGQSAIQSLSNILPSFPYSLLGSEDPSNALLHDPQISDQITDLLRKPDSGAGDNTLCRWLYDTFQCAKPDLQLVVLKFLPNIAGVYLSRVPLRKPLAGFEAVLLALYAHETSSRNGQPVTVNIPDLSHSSIYHETKLSPAKTNVTELNLAVVSPSLEPYGAVRSTRRARIVGVALELYYSKINEMPVDSKIAFCEFCVIWAGGDGEVYKEIEAIENNEAKGIEPENDKLEEAIENVNVSNTASESNNNAQEVTEGNTASESNNNAKEVTEGKTASENVENSKDSDEASVAQGSGSAEDKVEKVKKNEGPSVGQASGSAEDNKVEKETSATGRIPLPWELLQPVLRILGHCLMGPNKNKELYEAACLACRSLYARSLLDINPRAILATGSLLRLVKLKSDPVHEVDHTELPMTNVISI